THLDVGSIDALIGALKQYHGTLIFISHDVHFIRAIATSVLHVSAGQLTPYPGDYDYYLEKSKAVSAKTALTAGSNGSSGHNVPEVNGQKLEIKKKAGPGLKEQKAQKRLEAETRNAAAKSKRDKERRLHDLEKKIGALEEKQKELAAALEDPGAYATGGRATAINRELASVADDLAGLNAEWETAAPSTTALS
ncbi:MAG: ABC transporter ATP-binding protein, partial [Verrucomicrobiota bacterium]